MSKHFFLSVFFIFSIILTGCHQEQMLDGNNAEQIIPEDIPVDEQQDGKSIATIEKNRCLDANAIWEEMPNSCGNRCDYIRTPERVSCLMALTDACNCGEGMCWNGEGCEGN